MTQTVFITGSSSGIGRATAQHFHQQGWNVVATMRRPEQERELTLLPNVAVLPLDVTRTEQVEQAVEAALARFGQIDVLVNNAGFGTNGPFEAATETQLLQQFDTNVFGVLRVTRALLPHFRARRAGTVVTISSVGGLLCFPFASLYHSTKFALEGFTEGVSYELRPLGIRVKLIEPGGVGTDFYGRSMMTFESDRLGDYHAGLQAMQATMAQQAGGALATPEAVAEVVYQAATDGSERLRYLATPDAEQFVQLREQGFERFSATIRQLFGV